MAASSVNSIVSRTTGRTPSELLTQSNQYRMPIVTKEYLLSINTPMTYPMSMKVMNCVNNIPQNGSDERLFHSRISVEIGNDHLL